MHTILRDLACNFVLMGNIGGTGKGGCLCGGITGTRGGCILNTSIGFGELVHNPESIPK